MIPYSSPLYYFDSLSFAFLVISIDGRAYFTESAFPLYQMPEFALSCLSEICRFCSSPGSLLLTKIWCYILRRSLSFSIRRKMIPISSPKYVSFQKTLRFVFFDTIFFAVISLYSTCILSLCPGSCHCFPKWCPPLRRFCFMIPSISPDFSFLWRWCRILRRFNRFNSYFPLIAEHFSPLLSCLFSQNDTTFFARLGTFSHISLYPTGFDANFIAYSQPKKFSKIYFQPKAPHLQALPDMIPDYSP